MMEPRLLLTIRDAAKEASMRKEVCVKQTFYVWPQHLEEFIKFTNRRKKRDSLLLLATKNDRPGKIPVTLAWKQPELTVSRRAGARWIRKVINYGQEPKK